MNTNTNRSISRLLVLSLLLSISVLLFTSCGTSDAEKKFIGTWDLTEASMEGITLSADQLASYSGTDTAGTIEFKSGGKCAFKVLGQDGTVSWKLKDGDDDTVIIEDGSDKLTGYIADDGKLILEMKSYGMTLKLEKAK
ncbi:hypothetical protein [Mobilibacterium timonense]|uniref:hypothetical protein n=1 Tax=Mobilibacterium timonense TaxID=1871012 RepID=UPI002356CF74|nr:hypothetical protein [Mobilibacterium timonense]MBM6990634.1 hypothetical protein [Mobilibacterium timonense]